MIIVSDTGPLNYLVQVQAVDALALLYEEVLIPEAVRLELMREETPELVRDWVHQAPAWLSLHSVEEEAALPLGAGERQAILLAAERKVGLILMDERRGRQAAAQQGLKTIGTLGVLLEAHRRKILVLPDVLTRLRKTSFYISEALENLVLQQAESASE